MLHTIWTGSDGVPRVILCMGQAPNGILWLGSTRGLYTFDGLRFTLFRPAEDSPPLPTGTIYSLLIARNGDVWLFYAQGPPVRIRSNRVVVFGRSDGTTVEQMASPQEDSKGFIWALLNGDQLVRLGRDGLWHRHAAPSGTLSKLFVDSLDTIWLVVNDRLNRMPATSDQFSKTRLFVYGKEENAAVDGLVSIAESPSHDIWIAAASPGVPSPAIHPLQHVNQAGELLPSPNVEFTYGGLFADPDGSLWFDTNGYLVHIDTDELRTTAHLLRASEQNRALLPVAGDGAFFRAFLQEKDGSIWVGGLGGLERFAAATLVQVTPGGTVGFQRSCLSPSGVLWFTDRLGRLFRKQAGTTPQATRFHGVHNLSCSEEGEVVITRQGVFTITPRQITQLASQAGIPWSANRFKVEGAVLTSDGSVIAAGTVDSKGPFLWRFKRNQWKSVPLPSGKSEVSALQTRHNGSVLVGFGQKPPLILTGTGAASTNMASPGIGRVCGFSETTYGLFAYGKLGIALLVGDTFVPMPLAKPEDADRTSGLTEDLSGSLWLNANRGIIRVSRESVLRYLQHLAATVDSVSIQEGALVGPAIFDSLTSTAQREASGKLVFGSLDGVLVVDPQHLRLPETPLLSITRIAANDVELGPDRVFPPDVSRLTISYIGVEYNRPRDVSYRYRLLGLDGGWQTVGSLTEAMYTNIRPGRYQFEVQARNAVGQWSGVVTSSTFSIAPHYYQTMWFRGLLGCLFICTVALFFRIRLKLIAADIQSKANERADERIVIARDLHDTLLQGVQGLLLAFHAAADRVPDEHESKPSLERALETADKLIVEGRRTVKRLRSSAISTGEILPCLESLGREIDDRRNISFVVISERNERPLLKDVADQVVLIAAEAVRNAVQHAKPKEIKIEVHYMKKQFVLLCSDNGCGFATIPAALPIVSDGLGHWGLRGMHERASRIGAKIDISSAVGNGTVVHLVVPERKAYRD